MRKYRHTCTRTQNSIINLGINKLARENQLKLRQRIPGTKLLAVVGGNGSRAEEQVPVMSILANLAAFMIFSA
jgi:hypothetical protein